MSILGINANNVGAISNVGEVKGGSVQLMFAQLQMELAKNNKDAAMTMINGIRDTQSQSKNCTDMANQLRNLSSYDAAKYGNLPGPANAQAELDKLNAALKQFESLGDKYSGLKSVDKASQDYINEVQKTGSAFNPGVAGGKDTKHYASEAAATVAALKERKAALESLVNIADNKDFKTLVDNKTLDLSKGFNSSNLKDTINTAVANIESYQESISADTQQKMVLTQDYMGQYSANTQGAISSISNATQTATSVARGS